MPWAEPGGSIALGGDFNAASAVWQIVSEANGAPSRTFRGSS